MAFEHCDVTHKNEECVDLLSAINRPSHRCILERSRLSLRIDSFLRG